MDRSASLSFIYRRVEPGCSIGFFLLDRAAVARHVLVNSLAHVFGRRRYATDDTSRNSLLIALITMGEGWHNNHHYYQASARQGFFWWEIDLTYYVLKVLSWLGIVRDLKVPSQRGPSTANRVKAGAFDIGHVQGLLGASRRGRRQHRSRRSAIGSANAELTPVRCSRSAARKSRLPSRRGSRSWRSSCTIPWNPPRSWPSSKHHVFARRRSRRPLIG